MAWHGVVRPVEARPRKCASAPLQDCSRERSASVYNLDDMPIEEIARRALAAYFESDGDELPTSTNVQKLAGKRYVTLKRAGRLLACYRVRNDGKLKRLVRLPEGL